MSRPVRPVLNHSVGGPMGAPVLLLVHPMGADHRFWDDCRTIWEESFRCIAVDLRGAGRSPPLAGLHSIEAHADDLESFCIAERLERVVIIGCAVGAMISTIFAARSSERCAALVLSNPGYRTTPEASAALAARAAAVRVGGMASAAEAVDRSFLGHSDPERVEVYKRRFLAQDADAYALHIEGMLHADVSIEIGRITCPTLVVGGGRDVLLPLDHARKVVEALSRGELAIAEEGAHLIPYQYPGLFTKLAANFLKRAMPRAG